MSYDILGWEQFVDCCVVGQLTVLVRRSGAVRLPGACAKNIN